MRTAYDRYYQADRPRRRRTLQQRLAQLPAETKRGIASVVCFGVGIVGGLGLLGLAGPISGGMQKYLAQGFGAARWVVPFVFLLPGYLLARPKAAGWLLLRGVGALVVLVGIAGIAHLKYWGMDFSALPAGRGGGLVGFGVTWWLKPYLNVWTGAVLWLVVVVIGALLSFNTSLGQAVGAVRAFAATLGRLRQALVRQRVRQIQLERSTERSPHEPPTAFNQRDIPVPLEVETVGADGDDEKDRAAETEDAAGILTVPARRRPPRKVDLPLALLNGQAGKPTSGDIKANQYIIEKTLKNFGIEVEMGDVSVGPTVTQYTFKPAEGVKLSKIVSLSDNLALALAAHPIRIEAPIPGKSLVGVEVPNQTMAIVPLREVLDSIEFRQRKSNLMVALGTDVKGKPWLADLARMPHLMIAGATGSGKSVCINTIILSLLFQNGPDDLKLIMVDPKRVELPIYNGIPHLITPVITDVKATVRALQWAIHEMERRFDVLADVHQRDIAAYNLAAAERMPYLVVVIDELADLMVAAGPTIEGSIIRLAQMSRAVGIHLVIATQRPSVDVLTGLIKANITCRIAFSVASLVDSRTILDMSGAEKLLGRGDMLYLSAEISKPKRLQGAYATDGEIKRVIAHLKEQAEPEYDETVIEEAAGGLASGVPGGVDEGDGESDPLLPAAMEVIMREKKASASLLQRKIRVGYARAARILDLLEQRGVVGPVDGAKPREVLLRNGLGGATIENEAEQPDDDAVEPDSAADSESQ